MTRPSWTQSAILAVSLVTASGFATLANSQVLTLDRAPDSAVHPAGCDCGAGSAIDPGFAVGGGCASGGCASGGCGGTVWGSQCISSCGPCGVEIGLFPPCPNPCGGLNLGQKLRSAKAGIDCGIKDVFNMILSPKGCSACGSRGCNGMCTPLMMSSSCGCGECISGGCDMGGCSSGGCIGSGAMDAMSAQPTPASVPNVDATQPSPPATPNRAANPFTDDSASFGRGIRDRRANPHLARRAVQQASHIQPVPNTSKAEPRPNVLRRASASVVKSLRPAGRTTQARNDHRSRAASPQAIQTRNAAPRHFQRRRSAAMRPARPTAAPQPNAAPQEADAAQADDALLRFVD